MEAFIDETAGVVVFFSRLIIEICLVEVIMIRACVDVAAVIVHSALTLISTYSYTQERDNSLEEVSILDRSEESLEDDATEEAGDGGGAIKGWYPKLHDDLELVTELRRSSVTDSACDFVPASD